MARRVLPVLLVALGTACATAAGFSEAPQPSQIILVVAATFCSAVYEMISGGGKELFKKVTYLENAPEQPGNWLKTDYYRLTSGHDLLSTRHTVTAV